MMHFVRTFSIMRVKAQGLLLSKRFDIMEKLYTTKTFLKMAGGRMHIAYSSPCPPVSAPGHKLQKALKELAYFSHLAPLLLFFLLKDRVRKGREHGPMPSLNTLLTSAYLKLFLE